jgi:glutathione S-transferase
MSELVFYTNPMSRGRIVRWMLEEVGATYRVENVQFGATRDPRLVAINPMGKVPALVHGEAVVTEAAAICAYLADAFPAAGLAPPTGTPERGAYYRWLFFGAGPIEQAATAKALGLLPPPDKRGMVGFGTYQDVIEALDGALSNREFIAGDRFSAADLYIGSQLGWGMGFGTIEKRPSFEAYVARLYARPRPQARERARRRAADARAAQDDRRRIGTGGIAFCVDSLMLTLARYLGRQPWKASGRSRRRLASLNSSNAPSAARRS